MSDESAAPPQGITLGHALSEYVKTLKPDTRRAQEPFIRKYVEYAGTATLLESLTASRIESYAVDHIRGSDPNAPDRVAALKAWFAFLKKREYTATNYGVHIRGPKPSGRTAVRSTRVEEAPLEMTADGIDKLREELAELESARTETVKSIEIARQDGDLRENAPYHAAREQLSFTQQRISQIENALKRAVTVDRAGDDRSAVGSRVTVTRLDNGQQITYQLVGAREANAGERRISVESPVGKKLLGRSIGDNVSVDTPRGEIQYRVDGVDQA